MLLPSLVGSAIDVAVLAGVDVVFAAAGMNLRRADHLAMNGLAMPDFPAADHFAVHHDFARDIVGAVVDVEPVDGGVADDGVGDMDVVVGEVVVIDVSARAPPAMMIAGADEPVAAKAVMSANSPCPDRAVVANAKAKGEKTRKI